LPDIYLPINVLIVDDEKMIRDLLADTLSALGYGTITAASFDHAVEILETKSIDVVVTDVVMPDKSGVELIMYIKKKYSKVPVLAISGKGVPEKILYDAGADGFLAKPFRIGVVEDMITKTLIKYDIDKVKPMSEKKKILVVDDEPSILRTLIDSLEALGYQAAGANNGKEALESMNKDSFDLVITDIRMPEKNGIDLMKDIKAQYPDLPVVMITGYPLAYPPEKAKVEGASGYIAKPFRLNQIDKLLAKLLYYYENGLE